MVPDSDRRGDLGSGALNGPPQCIPNGWQPPAAVTVPAEMSVTTDSPRRLAAGDVFRIDSDDIEPADDTFATEAPLAVMELDATERLVAPFTTSRQQLKLHYRNDHPHRGYVQCVERGCPLCMIRVNTTVMYLYPVYDPLARAVRLLPISVSERPSALLPQFRVALRQVIAGQPLLVGIARRDYGQFQTRMFPWTADIAVAKPIIARFDAAVQAGTARIADPYPRLLAEELATLPDVAAAMRLRAFK